MRDVCHRSRLGRGISRSCSLESGGGGRGLVGDGNGERGSAGGGTLDGVRLLIGWKQSPGSSV